MVNINKIKPYEESPVVFAKSKFQIAKVIVWITRFFSTGNHNPCNAYFFLVDIHCQGTLSTRLENNEKDYRHD